MLTQLTISNFAIIRQLEIDFLSGMTVITGETGAGKSIAIDALGLCLGNRVEGNVVRAGAKRADLCVRFAINATTQASIWLEKNHLDDGNECLLRRVINADGRSRAFINGTSVPLSQLRELGQYLIQICGQHAYQQLLTPHYQKMILDAFASESQLLCDMHNAYQRWHQSCHDLEQCEQRSAEREARKQLLHYQLKELNELAPSPGEFEKNDEEYKRLANRGQLLTLSQQALDLLSENDKSLLNQLHNAKQLLLELAKSDNTLIMLPSMLEEASIQTNEVSNELHHYAKHIDLDSNRLLELEQRLSLQLNLARKHHITPEELPELHLQLLKEQEQLELQESNYSLLTAAVKKYHQQALEIAEKLHTKRCDHAIELSKLLTENIRTLAMPHGNFTINVQFSSNYLSADGANHIEFHISANPGQPLQPLDQVASGGELSRIALALQIITARKMETPALIFDEIDAGISGATAATVGQLLRQLGESTQVICVTHLPQVAGCSHHHFFVSKKTDGIETETSITMLDNTARLQEIARLLAGNEVTQNTLANAKELLLV